MRDGLCSLVAFEMLVSKFENTWLRWSHQEARKTFNRKSLETVKELKEVIDFDTLGKYVKQNDGYFEHKS